MDDATLERFADVIVGFGANVQPGQIVSVSCEPGKEFMVRAIAASAYRHGAKFVDVQYFDPWVKRARIEHGREEDLDFIPDWHGKRLLALGEICRQATGSRAFAFVHADNGSLTRLIVLPDGGWLLRSFNDTAHLG